jgi:hypothetical protein
MTKQRRGRPGDNPPAANLPSAQHIAAGQQGQPAPVGSESSGVESQLSGLASQCIRKQDSQVLHPAIFWTSLA